MPIAISPPRGAPSPLAQPSCWQRSIAPYGPAPSGPELPGPNGPRSTLTYLASDNERSALAQRGHSKQKRFDLRQFSLALLVARDGQIPLYADVYEGNTVDATRSPASLTAIRHRVERLVGQLENLTLVYDKGNNSKHNQALVDQLPVHYVASLAPGLNPTSARSGAISTAGPV